MINLTNIYKNSLLLEEDPAAKPEAPAAKTAAPAGNAAKLPDKNKMKKNTAPVCSLGINTIFTQLHFKALEKSKAANADYKIGNSAIEGDKASSATFYGGGTHIIGAIPIKGEPDKEKATAAMKVYLTWFIGPDIAQKLKPDNLFPLESSQTTTDAEEKAKKAKKEKEKEREAAKKNKNDNENESRTVPSFSDFLTEADPEEDDDEEDNDKEDKNEEDKKNSTKGYYLTYKLDINGKSESKIEAGMKRFTDWALNKVLAGGIGIRFIKIGGGAGEEHVLGGSLGGAIDKIMGKIDPDKLLDSYNKNFTKKFKQTRAENEIWDTKTINQFLKKNLSSSDHSKIAKADYALCTKIDKADLSYKLINSSVIADILTKSISGIYSRFKNRISKKDVILVNNYSDNKKEKAKFTKDTDREEGSVADSQIENYYGTLLSEDGEAQASSDNKNGSNNPDVDAANAETDKKNDKESEKKDENTRADSVKELDSDIKKSAAEKFKSPEYNIEAGAFVSYGKIQDFSSFVSKLDKSFKAPETGDAALAIMFKASSLEKPANASMEEKINPLMSMLFENSILTEDDDEGTVDDLEAQRPENDKDMAEQDKKTKDAPDYKDKIDKLITSTTNVIDKISNSPDDKKIEELEKQLEELKKEFNALKEEIQNSIDDAKKNGEDDTGELDQQLDSLKQIDNLFDTTDKDPASLKHKLQINKINSVKAEDVMSVFKDVLDANKIKNYSDVQEVSSNDEETTEESLCTVLFSKNILVESDHLMNEDAGDGNLVPAKIFYLMMTLVDKSTNQQKIKKNNTETDFYIIPMKGLKYKKQEDSETK